MESTTASELTAETARSDGPWVVVGVDGSVASSAALRWAADEARLRGARLKVVRAWQFPAVGYGDTVALPPDTVGSWGAEASAALEEQLAQVLGETPGPEVVREVTEGPAAKVILEAAKGAQLVVVGSRGRGGFSGLLLGSVSAQVAHHAPCPVTIVRSEG